MARTGLPNGHEVIRTTNPSTHNQQQPMSNQISANSTFLPENSAPRETPLMQGISLAARLLVGFVMLIAGAGKLGAIEQFGHNIYNYQLLPLSLVNIAALLFVWVEITIGILLIVGAAVRGSALLSGALLLLFIAAVLWAMSQGLEIDCGCFGNANGEGGVKVGWPKVLENLGLLAASIFLLYLPRS